MLQDIACIAAHLRQLGCSPDQIERHLRQLRHAKTSRRWVRGTASADPTSPKSQPETTQASFLQLSRQGDLRP
jgi:hypothetical protein